MIVIALPNQAEKLLDNNTKWCYLGKDLTRRERVARVLGEKDRFYLKDRIHRIAEKLRVPYADLVAELGKGQKNQLNWWASKFASKSHVQTDFFLLFCYKVLAGEIIRQQNSDDKLVIFIEDRWLFADIRNSYKDQNIVFLGTPNLFLTKCFLFLRGLVHKLLLVPWVFAARIFIFCYHGGKKPKILKTEKTALAIMNPAEERAFEKGRYANNFMPGLPDFYKEKKIPFFYVYPLYFPLTTVKHVGRNKQILWPLILDLKVMDAVKRIFERWRPILESGIPRNTMGQDTALLLERERWVEFSSAGFNLHLLLFDALDSFFRKNWCNSIIYVFENQPSEKMLCMAAFKNNIKTVGYQHSVISRIYFSQFIAKDENLFAPLPYTLITSGNHSARLYKEGGIPEEKVAIGGAWRYQHVINDMQYQSFTKKSSNSKPTILICLSKHIATLTNVLNNISRTIAKNHMEREMEFWLKLHPGNTERQLKPLNKVISKFKVVKNPFHILLKDVDTVISSASIGGLEAFLCGKKVVYYIPENIFVSNPLMDITSDRLHKWYEGEDLNIDFLTVLSSLPDPDALDALRRQYFSRINHEMWLNMVVV